MATFALNGCGGDLDREYRLRFWEKYQSDGEKALLDNRLDAAKTLFNSAVSEAQSLQANDFRLAISLDRLATVCLAQGKDDEAQKYLEHAVKVYEREQSPSKDSLTRKEVVRSYRALADITTKKKKFKQACEIYSKAVNAYRQSLAPGTLKSSDWLLNEDYVRCLYGLAIAYDAQAENGIAEKHFERALQAAEENQLPKPFVESVQADYAKFLRKTNRLQQADRIEGMLRESGEEKQQTDLLRQWTELHDSSVAEADRKQWNQAEAHCRSAWLIARKLGETNIHVLMSVQQLLRIFLQARNYEAAYSLISETSPLVKTFPDSKELDNLITPMARLQETKQNWSEAIELTEQRINLRKRLRGSENEHVAEALYDAAKLYLKVGRIDVAQARCNEAISILQKSTENKSKELAEAKALLGQLKEAAAVPQHPKN